MSGGYLQGPLNILVKRCVVAATLECLQLAGRGSGDSVIETLQSPSALFLSMMLPT
jgi:hypothetical protein